MEFNNWLNLFCLLFIIFLKIKIANLFPTMLKVLLIGQRVSVASVLGIDLTFVMGSSCIIVDAIGVSRLVALDLPAFILTITIGSFRLYTYLLIVNICALLVTSDLLYTLYVITSIILDMVMLAHYNNSNKSSSTHETTAISTTLTKCPSCSNEKIITDSESGEIICSKCGRVISDKLQEMGPEWRTFAPTKQRQRVELECQISGSS